MAGGLTVGERLALARKVQEAAREAVERLGRGAGRDAIAAEVLRSGGFSDAELDAPAPNLAATRHNRLVDYQLAWAIERLERDGLLTEPEPEPAPPRPRRRFLRRGLAR
jgi:hypothetical protein